MDVDDSGGRLQKEMSDIVLIIPQGAVSETKRVDGAVYTDLDKAGKKLGLAESECIVSPIAEYHTPGTFRKPVTVVLPHFLPPTWRVDTDRVYVYQIDGKDGKLTKTKLNLGLKYATGRAGTCCIDDKVVRIFTDHFTAFVVCADCQERSLPRPLLLDVWAKHIERDTGSRLVEVRLYVWIGVKFYCKDIRAALLPANDLVNFKGMKSFDLRPMDRYPGFDPDVTFTAQLTIPQSTWCFKDGPISYPASVSISLDNLSPCAPQCQRLPEYQLRMWQLTNEGDVTPDDLWQGSVIGSYVTKDGNALSKPQPIGVDIAIRKIPDPERCNSSWSGGLKQAEAPPCSVMTSCEACKAPHPKTSINISNVKSLNFT
ncbi:uncharacterized protein [Littorina saxatilis]|uniref:uncharacterized protein n=1 Tax=Littorina saxatilis TaxID=31220 RepID=UPI0038B4254A